MIETLIGLMALSGIGTTVDPTVPEPYTTVSDPCAVVAQINPSAADWCAGAASVSGGLGYQIEMGGFRFWLTEGDFFENGYIARYGYDYPFDDSGLQTARVYLALVCVDDSGAITPNGPGVPVVANRESTPIWGGDQIGTGGSGSVTLQTTGPCPVGSDREIFSGAVVSDSDNRFWTPGTSGINMAGVGWVNGDPTYTVSGYDTTSGFRSYSAQFQVEDAPEYGATGSNEVSVRITWNGEIDNPQPGKIQSGLTLQAVYTDGTRSSAFPCYKERVPAGSRICTVTSNPSGSKGFAGVTVYGSSWYPNESAKPVWYAEGHPDRYEPDGALYVLGSLTRYQNVADMQWAPTEQDLAMGDLAGICDDIGECVTRCFDQDYSWNPVSWWDGLLETIKCLVIPESSPTDVLEAANEDFRNSIPGQSLDFYVSSVQRIGSMPSYFARSCGELVSFDEPYAFEISTCDLPSEARGYIRLILEAIIGIAAAFAVGNLIFWAMGIPAPRWMGGKGYDETEDKT